MQSLTWETKQNSHFHHEPVVCNLLTSVRAELLMTHLCTYGRVLQGQHLSITITGRQTLRIVDVSPKAPSLHEFPTNLYLYEVKFASVFCKKQASTL